MKKKLPCKFLKEIKIVCDFREKQQSRRPSEHKSFPSEALTDTAGIGGQVGGRRGHSKHASSLEAAPVCSGHKRN